MFFILHFLLSYGLYSSSSCHESTSYKIDFWILGTQGTRSFHSVLRPSFIHVRSGCDVTRIPSVHLASVSLSYLPSPASPLLATLVSLSSPYPAERSGGRRTTGERVAREGGTTDRLSGVSVSRRSLRFSPHSIHAVGRVKRAGGECNGGRPAWMTVKGAATRGLFVWPITVIPAPRSTPLSFGSAPP